MFGTTVNDNVEVKSSTSLKPGIYTEFELDTIESTNAEKKDGTQGKAILTFLFKKDGVEFTHTEWETDDESKAKNLSKRVKHILKAAGVSEESVNISASSFKEYADKVVALGSEIKNKVDFKVVGSVYNDKPKAGFPNYLGFIVATGTPLSFSNNELSSNEEFNNWKPGSSESALDSIHSATQGLFAETTVFNPNDVAV